MIAARLKCEAKKARKALWIVHPDWSRELIRQNANVQCGICADCGKNPIAEGSVRNCDKCGIARRKRERNKLGLTPHVISGRGVGPKFKGEKIRWVVGWV